jgi:hypothetical protein
MSDETDDADVARATKLLPAWFVPRMMTDTWFFGLLLVTGEVAMIDTIHRVHQDAAGGLWLDVGMLESNQLSTEVVDGRSVLWSPTSRHTATINAAHVVAAFELADT